MNCWQSCFYNGELSEHKNSFNNYELCSIKILKTSVKLQTIKLLANCDMYRSSYFVAGFLPMCAFFRLCIFLLSCGK